MAQEIPALNHLPPEKQEVYEEFQFLLCDKCKQKVESPKLLPCLHNLCVRCLEEAESVGVCPVCLAPQSCTAGTSRQDNLLFANLQAKMNIHQKMVSGKDAVCDNCKKEGEFWCLDCEEFLCVSCFQTHQRYLKKESHEARPLKDFRTESFMEFLATIKKLRVMFCPNADHKVYTQSIYCNACTKSMCCICAFLDSQHTGQHCDIRKEIQRRQDELQHLNLELKEKESFYENTYNILQEQLKTMEEVRNETKEQIQQKVDAMVQHVQEKGEKLIATLEKWHGQFVQDFEGKMQLVEGMRKRMASSKQLVEKMHLYASDQEMMDMHHFILKSLKYLKRKQTPAEDFKVQVENFTEIKHQLQALFDQVTKTAETVPATFNEASHQNCLGKSPSKRKRSQEEEVIQTSEKVIKTQRGDCECNGADGLARGTRQDQAGLSSEPTGRTHGARSGDNCRDLSNERWFPSSSSSSSSSSCDTDVPLCPKKLEEDGSDSETADSELQDDGNSQEDLMRTLYTKPKELDSEQGTMVFFDLKYLCEKTLHLAAITEEDSSFSVVIQPLLLSPSSDMEDCLCEIGLNYFFSFLRSLHKPILVGYNLWALDLPLFIKALEVLKKDEEFRTSIFGFLDALPLIKEKIPKMASYKLKSLDSKYFWGQLDDTQATNCAKTLKDLCSVFDVNPAVERRAVVAYSKLQCYGSLQPLLRKKVLTGTSAQTLAWHDVHLSVLQSVYQNDPVKGLQKFRRYLNSRLRKSEKKIPNLNEIRDYFQVLP